MNIWTVGCRNSLLLLCKQSTKKSQHLWLWQYVCSQWLQSLLVSNWMSPRLWDRRRRLEMWRSTRERESLYLKDDLMISGDSLQIQVLYWAQTLRRFDSAWICQSSLTESTSIVLGTCLDCLSQVNLKKV